MDRGGWGVSAESDRSSGIPANFSAESATGNSWYRGPLTTSSGLPHGISNFTWGWGKRRPPPMISHDHDPAIGRASRLRAPGGVQIGVGANLSTPVENLPFEQFWAAANTIRTEPRAGCRKRQCSHLFWAGAVVVVDFFRRPPWGASGRVVRMGGDRPTRTTGSSKTRMSRRFPISSKPVPFFCFRELVNPHL